MHSRQAELVDLPDGSKCDRRKVSYLLRQNPGDLRVFHATDRSYIKQPDGSLRRVGKKMSREDRREEKRIKREAKRRVQ